MGNYSLIHFYKRNHLQYKQTWVVEVTFLRFLTGEFTKLDLIPQSWNKMLGCSVVLDSRILGLVTRSGGLTEEILEWQTDQSSSGDCCPEDSSLVLDLLLSLQEFIII